MGKPIDAISEADLIEYFKTARQESTIIEYKSYSELDKSKQDEKVAKIIRSVAAMLNSSGGLIIWGAPHPIKIDGTKEHVVKGDLSPVAFEIGSDQFSNIIFSNISPAPKGVSFRPIKLAGDQYVYLIEVQPSQYPPHQYEWRYYARFDGVTKPAPHYLVEALMKQVKYPQVQGCITFGKSHQGRNYTVIPAAVSIFNLDRYQPVLNLCGSVHTPEGGFSLAAAGKNSEFEDGLQESIDLKGPLLLLNHMPYFARFIVVAKNGHNERHKMIHTMDMMMWADNVPIHYCRYSLEHSVQRQTLGNSIIAAVVFENKPMFELAAEENSSEQELMDSMRQQHFESFKEEFYETPIVQRLLGNRRW